VTRAPSAALSVAGGFALGLAFPAVDWAGAAWVALAPVLAVAVSATPRSALALGWLAGVAFFLPVLRWLNYTFRVYSAIPWPLTWGPVGLLATYCALYVGLVALAVAWVARRRGRGAALALAPFLWVAAEWVRGRLFGGFPWALLGYSQYTHLAVIQVAELGGVWAVSFLLAAANAALAGAAVLDRRSALRGLVLAAALIVASLAFGAWRLGSPAPPGEVKVAAMQPAIEQPLKWEASHTAETLRVYGGLTRAAAAQRPDLIVWPETASPTILRQDPELLGALRELSGRWQVPLLVGTVDVADTGRPRNTAFLLTGAGIVGRYDKIHLVPFGEFVPLAEVIGFVRGWAEFISELEPGSRTVVFQGPPAPLGVVICYEGIFPDLFRRFVQGGARLMVNMTNDGWFGRTEGPLQHLGMYPLRAVEHRTAVVRAANTGVSAFIDPTGRIIGTLGLFQRGNLIGEVPLRRTTTLYTRLGDWLPYLALTVSAGGLLAAARRS
jgi:apolipoprotein N-acyltransferase